MKTEQLKTRREAGSFDLTKRGKIVLGATGIAASFGLAFGAVELANSLNEPKPTGECAVGEVQPGLGGISAVEDALKQIGNNSVSDQDITYRGQQANQMFAADGEIKPGEAAEVCISTDGKDIVSLNSAD